jgi:hypothetical protein
MKLLCILCLALLLFPAVASAKIIGNFSGIITPIKTVSFADAKVNETNLSVITPTPKIEELNHSSWIDDKVKETTTVLEKSVTDGIKGFFIGAADSVFNIGGSSNESTNVKNNYGYAVGSVFKIATYSNDPYESPTVQAMRARTAVIGVFLFVLYVFYGAACVNLSCGGGGVFERAQYILTQTPFSEYKNTLIRTFGAIFLTHYLFKFIILFNQAVTTQAMYSVLDAIPFQLDNWVMYLAMSVCYGLESVFFTMRIILMDLIAGSDILIGALFAFSFTREMSMETIKYFGKITLLQFVIVLLTAFGITIIESLPTGKPLGYLCLILILVVVSGGLVFGFSRIFSASKVAIKGAL